MKASRSEAQKCLCNYAELMRNDGCGKTEIFHNLLAEFNGTPYVWGGEDTEGSDCSGSVCASLNALFGKDIRITADDLFKNRFTQEPDGYKGIQAAFFLDKNGKAVHVCGYMGQGLFMNQSSVEENGGTPRTLGELTRKNQECRQNEDGSVYLSFESNQMQETLFWALRFGASVTVLNPPELKEMYAAEVRKMAEKL